MPKSLFLACLLCCCAIPPTFAAEEAAMPIILFRKEPQNPDRSLPNIHPPIPDATNSLRIVSVQEGDRVRVALYNKDFTSLHTIRLLQNPTGQDLTGLPAGEPKHRDRSKYTENCIRFGNDITREPFVEPSKKFGTSEWPHDLWWQRVHGNYYHVRLYSGHKGTAASIQWEGIFTDRTGQDCSIYLGESFEKPGAEDFVGGFAGGSIYLDPPQSTWPTKNPIIYLIEVQEKDLPADFPKDLVRWIP